MNSSNDSKLIYLDRNEYNFDVAPLIEETFRTFSPLDFTHYTRCFQRGIKSELSEYIAQLYGIPEKNVVLGYGAESVLKGAIHCFLSRKQQGQKILLPAYSWWYYKSIANEVNGLTQLYPLYEDVNTFRYDIPQLKKQIKEENPDMLLLASPNNPTGNSLTLDEIREILDSVDQKTVVVIDEAYAMFNREDVTYIAPLIEKYPNLLIVRTFSKFYGLPGLRLGYAFRGDNLQEYDAFSTMYLGYNILSEKLGIAALKSTDYYLEKAQIMNAERELYKKELNVLPGFLVYESDANFVLVKYPLELKSQLQESLTKENLILKFMNEEGLTSHLRITLGKPEDNAKVRAIIKKVSTR